MSSDLVTVLVISVALGSYIVTGGIFAVAAYFAFSLRRAVTNRYLKSQSLWLGLVSATYVFLLPTSQPYTAGLTSFAVGIYSVIALPLLTLAWIDSTIRIERRSDPLFRDTLSWSKLRIAVWALTLVLWIPTFLFYNQLASTNPVILEILLAAPFLPATIPGAPALFLSARRAGNKSRRENVKWIGLFAVFILFALTAFLSIGRNYYTVDAYSSSLLFFLGFRASSLFLFYIYELFIAISAFCLYRCARSLAPLNPLSKIEITETRN